MTKQEISLEEKIYNNYHKNACETYEDPESKCNCGLWELLNALQQKQSLAALRANIGALRIKPRHAYKDVTKNKDRYVRVITYNKAIEDVLSLLQDKEGNNVT